MCVYLSTATPPRPISSVFATGVGERGAEGGYDIVLGAFFTLLENADIVCQELEENIHRGGVVYGARME